jgi:hypothetical protein
MIEFILFVSYFYGFNSLYRNLINDPLVKSFENANYLYTGLHAILASFLSFIFITNTISQNTYINLIIISPAFALFDITMLIDPRNKVNTKTMLIIHHLLIMLGCLLITDKFRSKDQHILYIAVNFLSELSTPFLNMSIFLNRQKYTNNIIFKINSFLVMFTYFVFRIIIPGQITYHIYLNDSILILAFQLFMNSMNYFWFYKLCKKCLEFYG